MTTAQILYEIAALAAGAIGRHIAPAVPRIARKLTPGQWNAAYNAAYRQVFNAVYEGRPVPAQTTDAGRAAVAPAVAAARKALAKRQAPTVMFDSITVSPVEAVASTSGEAVAGYVDGYWPDYHALSQAFPHDNHLSIAVHADDDADALDIENGDAAPAQAPSWVKRQHARGLARPVIYCSISTAPEVLNELRLAGIDRQSIRLWSAHYTYRAHICGPRSCGQPTQADATQWTDKAYGRNLDESLCAPGFFA